MIGHATQMHLGVAAACGADEHRGGAAGLRMPIASACATP
jgi:hypothetical protein